MLIAQAIFLSFVVAVISLICLAHSVFLFKDKRIHSMRPILMTLVGLALCLGASLLCKQLEKTLANTAASMRQPPTIAVQDLPSHWESTASLSERAEYSRMVAQRAYVEGNIIREYYDEYGLKHPYEPTAIDKDERARRVAKIHNFEQIAVFLGGTKWFWLIWPVISLLLGALPIWRRIGNFLEARLGFTYS